MSFHQRTYDIQKFYVLNLRSASEAHIIEKLNEGRTCLFLKFLLKYKYYSKISNQSSFHEINLGVIIDEKLGTSLLDISSIDFISKPVFLENITLVESRLKDQNRSSC